MFEQCRYDRPFSCVGTSLRSGPPISQIAKLASGSIVCVSTRRYGQQTTLFKASTGLDIEPLTRPALSLPTVFFVSTQSKHRPQTAEMTLITARRWKLMNLTCRLTTERFGHRR